MRFILFLSVFISCSNFNNPEPRIYWRDIAGTTWGITEELNIYQNVYHSFRFGIGDTLYLTKKYWNPRNAFISWYRYIKGPCLNKHYENDPVFNTPNLVFTWKRKEYADPEYQTPVTDNSIVDDWFLDSINPSGQLQMGYVDLDRKCYFWILDRE